MKKLAQECAPVPDNLFFVSTLILALDIGTSSLKTALFDERGRRLEKTTAHQAYSLRVAHDGTAELAVRDLEQAALRALRATLLARKKIGALKDRPIVAVAASCFWHSLLGYDARRQKPTPIYTWADARCHEDALRLRSLRRETSYHTRTGCMLRTPYWPAKLRWLARTGAARGVTSWMSPAEWLCGRLAGKSTVSVSMASGTGLMDLRACAWDASLLRLAGIRPESLGEISDEPFRIAPKNSSLPILHFFSELKDAPWFPALGDGAASNLGSDAVTGRTAAMNVGTSAALRLVAHRPPARPVPGLFCYRVDADRCLLGGAISNAGNLRAWALHQLRLPDNPAALERALSRRMLPSRGLTVLPFWTGERSPSWPATVGGTITGLTYATTALDLLQALVESTYHRLAQIADLLERQSGHRLDLVVSGGIRHSPESLQRLANVLGRPLRICAEPEASLRGAAVHALERLGKKAQPLPAGPAIRPHAAAARLYAEVRAAQISLEEKTSATFSTHRHPALRKKKRRT
jgi:gluconokinase